MGSLIGASLSEPHTSRTAFQRHVYVYVCLLAVLYHKLKIFTCYLDNFFRWGASVMHANTDNSMH